MHISDGWLLLIGAAGVAFGAFIVAAAHPDEVQTMWALLLLGADLISSFIKWWPWSAWETTVVALLVYIAGSIRVCAGVIWDELRHHITGVSHLGTIAQAIENLPKQIEDLRREVRDLNK